MVIVVLPPVAMSMPLLLVLVLVLVMMMSPMRALPPRHRWHGLS